MILIVLAAVMFSVGVLAGHMLRTDTVEHLKDDLDDAVATIATLRGEKADVTGKLARAREQLKWENQRARAIADVARFQRDNQILAEYEAEFRSDSDGR